MTGRSACRTASLLQTTNCRCQLDLLYFDFLHFVTLPMSLNKSAFSGAVFLNVIIINNLKYLIHPSTSKVEVLCVHCRQIWRNYKFVFLYVPLEWLNHTFNSSVYLIDRWFNKYLFSTSTLFVFLLPFVLCL